MRGFLAGATVYSYATAGEKTPREVEALHVEDSPGPPQGRYTDVKPPIVIAPGWFPVSTSSRGRGGSRSKGSLAPVVSTPKAGRCNGPVVEIRPGVPLHGRARWIVGAVARIKMLEASNSSTQMNVSPSNKYTESRSGNSSGAQNGTRPRPLTLGASFAGAKTARGAGDPTSNDQQRGVAKRVSESIPAGRKALHGTPVAKPAGRSWVESRDGRVLYLLEVDGAIEAEPRSLRWGACCA